MPPEPCATVVAPGARWTSSHLCQRLAGRFGLTGVPYPGARTAGDARRPDHEGLCAMMPQAMRAFTDGFAEAEIGLGMIEAARVFADPAGHHVRPDVARVVPAARRDPRRL